jgi:XTP/dITP diphosphohydrolase
MKKPQLIHLGTGNLNKVREMSEMLSPFGISIVKAFADGTSGPEENGKNYIENARIKMNHALKLKGPFAIADDSGLSIDALDGAPGLHSARFGGEDLPHPEKIRLILEKLANLPMEKRTARFHCAIVLSDGQEEVTFHETCEGIITTSPAGGGGFGFDPIFQPIGYNQTFAELDSSQKHKISHRGKAVAKLLDFIKDL